MDYLSEYKRTLKLPEAEEFFDLILYRPLAYLFVRLIARTSITPNQVTIGSMLLGIVAAYFYSKGVGDFFPLAGMIYAGANILDCADGQLARLQNSGTLFGRVIDGVADYVSSVAIFLGIGIGLSGQIDHAWIFVVVAGISSAVHAMFFDHYQGEFISTVRSEPNFLEREMSQFSAELRRLRLDGGNPGKIVILRLYLWYLNLQKNSGTKQDGSTIDPQLYREENSRMIRLWSFLGPTTNRTALILCSFIGRVDIYLDAVILAGNLWLICCFILQRRIHQRLAGR